MHTFNNCETKDKIARDHLFESTGNVKIYHQQEKYKEDEQTVDSDTGVSVSSTEKKQLERIKNRFALKKASDKRRVRFDRNDYDEQW